MRFFYLVATLVTCMICGYFSSAQSKENLPLLVRKCTDFNLTGKGNSAEWVKTGWNMLNKIDSGGKQYESKFKMMSSTAGIYLLFNGHDHKITTGSYMDFEAIYSGDVFEAFFHPDPRKPIYFEYEINPLNKELALVLAGLNGRYSAWRPWADMYNKEIQIKKMVTVTGGEQEMNGHISSWSAEIFIPFALMGFIPGVPPESGTIWNANFCRLDYDSGKMVKWSWSPTIKTSFHELENFLSIRFE